ncbi:imelysin family protein [Christiangramia flava]|uniref:Iron-regulated protein A n=1 Tax=Christiangramia flava JLT2011 TaxID=1229726 RepID=A0A1L7I211_9FLAO|nr:imelysin family protein [Christiangramia flava]APU67223.1 Iron-regulated protein A precursor [Christiangramia flava JLT2011]OSS39808.1 Iron-regulated protein A precursor [Christiangramia flava JLT2011]
MKKISIIMLLALLSFAACSTEDDGSGDQNGGQTDSFDRGAMLSHWADDFIVPAFQNFSTATNSLNQATETFAANPSAENLTALRAAYRSAYIDFQSVSMFEIGKAEELNYRNFLNTYPANTENIQSKIASGSYNLELPSSFAEQGFPAIDYLLYGLAEDDTTLLEYYTSGENAENYRAYLSDAAARINDLTAEVTASWTGSYRDTFVENTSSSSTGSVDRFTNDFVMYFEKFLRSGKIGYPAGVFSGTPSPVNVEALYAGDLSKELYQEAVNAYSDFYEGEGFGSAASGKSYKQYLQYLDSMKDGQDLAALISTQFAAISNQSAALDANLKNQVETDNSVMLAAYDELQKAVVLLKLDMMQALSISVDYVDSDGD